MLRNTTALLRRIGIEIVGWVLVVLGIAALVLPGPGLVLLALGLFVLATQYEWAERRLEPVKKKALETAADGVETWPRILLSFFGVAWLIVWGVIWGISPDVPGWWPLTDRWWLPGGWGTGASLIVSGFIAGALIVYSLVNYESIRATERAGAEAATPQG